MIGTTEDTKSRTRMPGSRRALAGAAVLAASGLAGCSGLLDVQNPNSLVQDDLNSPAAAAALANGALSTVARGFGEIILLHGTAADELKFTGSRDAWVQIQEGDLRDPANEFSDAAWPFVVEGRWMADEAIRLLSTFDAEGTLTNRNLLARAQLYAAIIYTQIADTWEDFVISDRTNTAGPVGSENMLGLYDQAIGRLDSALEIVRISGNASLEAAILAQRARTRHARAVRSLITPAGTTPANPLVNDPGAVSDAQAALAMVGADWQYRFTYSASTISNNWGAWVNERLELRPSDLYVIPTANDKQVQSVSLQDPIDGVPDPALVAIITEAVAARQYGPITVVSARELRLILAEAALAAQDETGFGQQINLLRSADGLSDWTGQIPARQMLQHARTTGLYMTGRRLNDHYRFGTTSALWNPNAAAAQRPGTLFPIAEIERTSNCFIQGTC
ncbi:MAG: hypothetical protein EA350_03250 [Gemmatimonadales bacterium]|nr:MAG: hypothetical protein EA350_03250 [Gemmatimonadales bacterium]